MTTVSRLRSSAEISSFLRSFCICVGQHGHSLLAQQRNIINQTTFSLWAESTLPHAGHSIAILYPAFICNTTMDGQNFCIGWGWDGPGGLINGWSWLFSRLVMALAFGINHWRQASAFFFSSISTGGLLVSEIDPASHGKGLSS